MDHTQKVELLIEALPYVNRFRKQIIVIKYGGNAMINDELKHCVMQDILLMKSDWYDDHPPQLTTGGITNGVQN